MVYKVINDFGILRGQDSLSDTNDFTRYHAFVIFLYKFSYCGKKGWAHSHQQCSSNFFFFFFFKQTTHSHEFFPVYMKFLKISRLSDDLYCDMVGCSISISLLQIHLSFDGSLRFTLYFYGANLLLFSSLKISFLNAGLIFFFCKF